MTSSSPRWIRSRLTRRRSSTQHAAATRHLEVIDAEIHRLDRVVQTLVDFSRPVELRLQEQEIKAGLLYNFLKYIEWPSGSVASAAMTCGTIP